MSNRLAAVCLVALSLAGTACSGPSGLRAQGTLTVSGSTASGPFDATFDFPRETQLDGSAGFTAMCTVSRSADGGPNGVVLDLIVPTSAGSPLDSVSVVTHAGATTGTIEADVRGTHYANTSCDFTASFVEADGTVQVVSEGSCVLADDAGGGSTVASSMNLVIRGCTVIGG